MNNEQRAEKFEQNWLEFVANDTVTKYAAPYRSPEMIEQGYEHAVILIHIVDPTWLAALQKMQETIGTIPWVKLTDPDLFHVTIRGIGDIVPGKPHSGNQFAAANYEEMANAIERAVASRPPFTICLGRLNSWIGIAFAEVYDNGAIDNLRGAIAAAYPLPNEPFGDNFAPHITLATYTEDTSANPLIAAIQPFREPANLILQINALSLVRSHFSPGEGNIRIVDSRLMMLRGKP